MLEAPTPNKKHLKPIWFLTFLFIQHFIYKSLDTLLFLMFLKEVSYAHQACIYLIKNTEKNNNIVKYFYNLK